MDNYEAGRAIQLAVAAEDADVRSPAGNGAGDSGDDAATAEGAGALLLLQLRENLEVGAGGGAEKEVGCYWECAKDCLADKCMTAKSAKDVASDVASE